MYHTREVEVSSLPPPPPAQPRRSRPSRVILAGCDPTSTCPPRRLKRCIITTVSRRISPAVRLPCGGPECKLNSFSGAVCSLCPFLPAFLCQIDSLGKIKLRPSFLPFVVPRRKSQLSRSVSNPLFAFLMCAPAAPMLIIYLGFTLRGPSLRSCALLVPSQKCPPPRCSVYS